MVTTGPKNAPVALTNQMKKSPSQCAVAQSNDMSINQAELDHPKGNYPQQKFIPDFNQPEMPPTASFTSLNDPLSNLSLVQL